MNPKTLSQLRSIFCAPLFIVATIFGLIFGAAALVQYRPDIFWTENERLSAEFSKAYDGQAFEKTLVTCAHSKIHFYADGAQGVTRGRERDGRVCIGSESGYAIIATTTSAAEGAISYKVLTNGDEKAFLLGDWQIKSMLNAVRLGQEEVARLKTIEESWALVE